MLVSDFTSVHLKTSETFLLVHLRPVTLSISLLQWHLSVHFLVLEVSIFKYITRIWKCEGVKKICSGLLNNPRTMKRPYGDSSSAESDVEEPIDVGRESVYPE